MFVNKLFAYLRCAYLRTLKVFYCEIFNILFSCETKKLADFQVCITVPLKFHFKQICGEEHKYFGAQTEIFQGRGDFVELGHFDKYFVKNARKKGSQGKYLESFSPRYS